MMGVSCRNCIDSCCLSQYAMLTFSVCSDAVSPALPVASAALSCAKRLNRVRREMS